jgi:tRNA A-37 threonylcarbamoyl transferase component Bud32/tetratricopeptide (TPR) repeat protein
VRHPEDELTAERDAFAATLTAPVAGTEPSPSAKVEARADSIAEGTHVGRFIVLDAIGKGGFSVVYRAFDPQLNRVIALKLLRAKAHDAAELASRRDRLLREAQALAAVSHRNIVAVHDAGTHGGEVFLAMELLAGDTVLDWARRGARSAREIVDAYCGACAGLAAAHDAGLIHRDVKPANMIVTTDGELKVLDFGLARAADEPESASSRASAATPGAKHGAASAPTDRLHSDITRAGVVLGTPAYMAPEQHLEQRATPLSDQYSLCVSLYQSLYGELPFRGDDEAAMRAEIVAGRVRAAPRGAKVPRALRAIVLHGMACEPERRYESVRKLGAQLRWFLGRRRRRIRLALIAAGVAFLGGAVSVAAIARAPSAVCTGTERHWQGVWDPSVAGVVHASFAATGKPHAEDTFERVAAGMDAYRQAWIDLHHASCRATHVFGEQSAAELDRRMACLDRKLAKAETLVAALRGPQASEILDHAVLAVVELPRELGQCRDDGAASATLDADVRPKYDELRRELDRLDLLLKTGRYSDALKDASVLVGRASALGVGELESDAHALLGSLLLSLSRPVESDEQLRLALRASARVGDAHRAASQWLNLVRLISNYEAKPEGASEALFSARLAVESSGDVKLRLRWLNEASDLARLTGDFDLALDWAQQALALLADSKEIDGKTEAQVYKQACIALTMLGRPNEALAYANKEYEVLRDEFGERHPRVAFALSTIGIVLSGAGDYRAALEHARRATALLSDVLPQEHYAILWSRYTIADAAYRLGDLGTASEEATKAFAGLSAGLGPGHHHTLAAGALVAAIEVQLGQAAAGAARARQILDSIGEPSTDNAGVLSLALQTLARARLAERRFVEASALLQDAAVAAGHARGLDARWQGIIKTDRAALYLTMSRPEASAREYEAAVEVLRHAPPDLLARAEGGLAAALWAVGDERERALALARAAHARFERSGLGEHADAAELTAWLRDHGG